MHRAAVAAVTAASLALGVTAAVGVRAAQERDADRDAHELALVRVDDALGAVHDDARLRDALAGTTHATGASALLTGARDGLAAATGQARATLDASAEQVGDDDAPRVALADLLAAVEAAAPTASPVRARALTAEVAAAEQAVHAAVAAEQERVTAAQAAAAAAARAAAARTPAPGRAPAPAADRCATTYSGPAFYTSVPTEGGDGSNGRLPPGSLAAVSWTVDSRGTPFYLRADAAAALERLNVAFRAALGHDLALDLTYRDYDTQVAMRAALGSVAAVPGTSSHGTGLAIDVPELPCTYGWDTAARAWLVEQGPAYGWVSPTWARQNGSNPEYWHFEYRG